MSKAGKDKKKDAKIEKKWDNQIAKANGMMMKVPDEFMKRSEEFDAIHEEYIEAGKKFDKQTEDFKHLNSNYWYDLKKLLDKNEVKFPAENVEMGMNKEAIKDGVYIINFIPTQPGGGRGPMVM